MSLTGSPSPRCGEVWLINFDPTIGAEIKKTRPAVVLTSDALGKLPLCLVVPITEWKPAFAGNLWHVRIDPDRQNGLSKSSAADVLQLKSVDVTRYIKRIRRVSPTLLEEVAAALTVIEYQ
jgi:mRNA interferase MazF